MVAVFDHSRSTVTARLVLLALADEAASDGTVTAYKRSQRHLARKTRADRRTVQRALQTLVKLGELEVLEAGDGRDQADYRILLPTLGEGRQSTAPGAAGSGPTGGNTPPPSSPSNPGPPANHQPLAAADADGGQLPGIDGPPPADPTAALARALVRRVYDARTPRPAGKFVGLAKIAERLLAAGHSVEAVEAAYMATPAFTTAALEFQLNGGRTNGNGSKHTDDGRGQWAETAGY
jgi:hypothetical protein